MPKKVPKNYRFGIDESLKSKTVKLYFNLLYITSLTTVAGVPYFTGAPVFFAEIAVTNVLLTARIRIWR